MSHQIVEVYFENGSRLITNWGAWIFLLLRPPHHQKDMTQQSQGASLKTLKDIQLWKKLS